MSTYDIGRKYDCSNVTISNRLKENGIDIIQLTDLPIEQIIEDYNNGIGTHKLAVKYNCSDVMILDRLKRNSIHIRSLYEITTIDLPTQDVIDDYNNNMSTRKLGEKYGCNAETIRKTLKNNDIKLRSTKEAMNILSIMICLNCGREYEGRPTSLFCSECNSTGYCYKFDVDCREHNREKYDRECFFCSELEGINERHCVHHIDYNKNQGCDNTPDWKLVPLCRICHGITGGGIENRELWKARILWLLNNTLYIK